MDNHSPTSTEPQASTELQASTEPHRPTASGSMPPAATGDAAATSVLQRWADRCDRRGLPSNQCRGPEANYLVTAVETALRRGTRTPHLGRASRSWGSRVASPGDAVAILSCLREVLADPAMAPTHSGDITTIHLVLDQIMLQAVDAASGNLHAAARTDPLTGCANRRALAEDLRRATASAMADQLDLAVVAIDLDGLKKINDSDGHAAGDAALLGLVSTVRNCLRESDSIYRVGGDEFVILAPFTDEAGASELMHRVERSGGPRFSWGIASMSSFGFAAGDDPHQLIQAADADLYERRRHRHNRRLLENRRRRALAAAAGVVVAVAASMVASSELSPDVGPRIDAAIGTTSPSRHGTGSSIPTAPGSTDAGASTVVPFGSGARNSATGASTAGAVSSPGSSPGTTSPPTTTVAVTHAAPTSHGMLLLPAATVAGAARPASSTTVGVPSGRSAVVDTSVVTARGTAAHGATAIGPNQPSTAQTSPVRPSPVRAGAARAGSPAPGQRGEAASTVGAVRAAMFPRPALSTTTGQVGSAAADPGSDTPAAPADTGVGPAARAASEPATWWPRAARPVPAPPAAPGRSRGRWWSTRG